MKGFLQISICGFLLAGCATETPTQPEDEKTTKTVLGKPTEEEKPEANQESDRPILLIPSKTEKPSKPTNIEYEEGTDKPLTGVKYFQFPDGKKMREVPYLNGKKHGSEIRWYKNGKKYYDYNYWEGKKHGQIMEWSLEGELLLHEIWLHGKMEKKIL